MKNILLRFIIIPKYLNLTSGCGFSVHESCFRIKTFRLAAFLGVFGVFFSLPVDILTVHFSFPFEHIFAIFQLGIALTNAIIETPIITYLDESRLTDRLTTFDISWFMHKIDSNKYVYKC